MGRGKRKPDPKRPGGKWGKHDDRDNQSEFVVEKRNTRFESYYKEQSIVPDSEWEDLLGAFRASLPVTFRLSGSRAAAQDLNDLIKSIYIPHLSGVIFEGSAVPPPIQLPWYPDGLAWQLNVQKNVVRKSPEFKRFQDFLVYENDVGNISRQEAVSMIPPLVLDVEPHHKVLDMCAAPGSKTAQLLDALHSGPSGADPTGVVLANDSDYKRANMLVHQSARFHSTAMMVTNLDASLFPTLKTGDKQRRTIFFDRILCDVPCSGDGTLRKNMQIWNNWQPAIGNGIHPLQLRILLRAMQMLAPDGRIVYSTCSLNPVENEAVLAAALNSTPGQFQLVDVSLRLPGLKRRPGMSKWRVTVDKDATVFFDSQRDFLASSPTERDKNERGAKVPQTLFPPENARDLHLERSVRIYPHLQDTGGFFIAVLERTQTLPNPEIAQMKTGGSLKRTASNLSDVDAQALGTKKYKNGTAAAENPENTDDAESSVPPLDSEVADAGTEEAKVTTPPKTWKESPYTFFPPDHRHLRSCLNKLHIKSEAFADRIFVRTADLNHPRAVYVCNRLVRDIIDANDSARIRLINCGVKAFTRQAKEGGRATELSAAPDDDREDPGASQDVIGVDGVSPVGDEKDLVFRFVYEGVEAVLPYVDPVFVLVAGLKELRRMLEVYYPTLTDFGDSFAEQISRTTGGAHLVRFEAGQYDGAILPKPITLPIWISAKSLSLMSDKQTKSALCLRVFGEDFTPFGKELRSKRQTSSSRAEQVGTPAAQGASRLSEDATMVE